MKVFDKNYDMSTVFIVHGYQASPEKHWFPWLSHKIQSVGAACEIVHLEDADAPNYAVWKECLHMQIAPLDENSIVIAHSLGCISTLDFLSDALKNKKLKALFLVSPFKEPLSSLPELNTFIQQCKIDEFIIRTTIQKRFVFLSNNDSYVGAPMSIRLGQAIHAQLVEVKFAGHFMQEDGFTEFPQLWDKLALLLEIPVSSTEVQ